MLRVLRLLPVLIPIARRVLRHPKVREVLRLKPLPKQRRWRR